MRTKIMLHRFLIIIFLLISNIAIAETNNEEDKKIENLPNAEYYKQYEAVVDLIDKNYVQEPPDKQKMTDAALNAMLLELDPHSTYLTGEDLEDLLTHTKGEFGGIGVEIMYENGAIKIISALDDLPAHKANMETGDYIVGVNDEFVSNLGFYKSVKAMRGEPGTKVKLLVIKHDETKPKDIELIRETVKISPVKTSLEKNNVAYVRIKTFNEHTYKELKENIEKLKIDTNNDIKGIILDLRNNGGGLLNQAILVSEYFINNGIVVSTKGKAAGTSQEFFASKNSAKAPNVPMIILINGGSASASEIVAGALQDYKRGLIIGTKSFGKGSVQTLLPINNNAAVKLTTSKYYTPSGRSIQAEGILPDIIIDNAKVEFSKSSESDKIFSEKSLRGYLKNDTKEKIQNDLKDKNNNKIFDKKSVEKNKKPDNINNKKNDDELSELYKSDYQFARAFDIIMGLILTNNK